MSNPAAVLELGRQVLGPGARIDVREESEKDGVRFVVASVYTSAKQGNVSPDEWDDARCAEVLLAKGHSLSPAQGAALGKLAEKLMAEIAASK